MSQQQLNILQKRSKCIQFQYSLNQSQILECLDKYNYEEYLTIICEFDLAQTTVTKYFSINNQLIGLTFQSLEDISTLVQNMLFKNLNYLFISFICSEYNNQQVIEFGKSLSTLQSLQQLSLTIWNASHISFDGAKAISKSIQYMSQLIKFEYNLSFNNKFYDTDIIIELFTCLQYINRLTYFELTINQQSNIGDSGFYEITSCIKYLNNLETFILKIENKNRISDHGFKYLQNSLSSLTKLSMIRIEILENILYKQPITELIEGILGIESLVELQIKLRDCEDKMKNHFFSRKQARKNNNIQENKIEKINTTLKKLSLNVFEYYKTKNLKLERSIGSWINNCKSLEVFNCNINIIFEQEILNLENNNSLQFPQQLKKLSFQLVRGKTMDDSEKVFQKILSLTQLEKLNLQLNFCNFSDNIKYSIDKWFQNLKNLKELKITQISQEVQNASDFEYFSESLQNLKQLTFLSIDKFQIRNHEAILYLQTSFSQLKNLQYLCMRNIVQSDKKFGDSIIKAITNLENLMELKLGFVIQPQFAKYFLDECIFHFAKLDKLKKLNLKETYEFKQIKNYRNYFISSKYPRLVVIVK